MLIVSNTATGLCPTCYIQQEWHVDAPPPIVCLGWRCPGHMMTPTVAALGKEKRACTCQSKTDKIIRQSTISLCINNAFHTLLYVHYSTIVSHDSNSEVNRKRLPSQRVILGVCNPFTQPLQGKQAFQLFSFVLPHRTLQGLRTDRV